MVVDLVLKSFSRDYGALLNLLKSIRLYFTGYRDIHLYLDNEPGVDLFMDNPIFSDLSVSLHRVNVVPGQGYVQQQFYKLGGNLKLDADFLLPLDSDMVFFKQSSPDDWLLDGRAYIPYGDWVGADCFPPPGLVSHIIRLLGRRTHDMGAYISCIRKNFQALGVDILEDGESKLIFAYQGGVYDLNSSLPHRVWLASLFPVTNKPVDSMRAHYMFSRQGLLNVREVLESKFGVDLMGAMMNTEIFPIFSEYQVYGNLVLMNGEGDLNHVCVSSGSALYNDVVSRLPIVKCNTREDSSIYVYESILNGTYSHMTDRNLVLSKIRIQRAGFPAEQWG